MHFGQQPRGSSEATQLVERPQTKEPNKIVNLHPCTAAKAVLIVFSTNRW